MHWLAALLIFSLPAFPQGISDSLSSPYDSLQDLRVNRFETRIERQLGALETRIRESGLVRDSLGSMVDVLRQKAGQLEKENQELQEELRSIRQEADHASEESLRYRENLEHTLWIAGTVLTMLVVASFLFLMLFTLRIRWRLEQLKTRVNRLRKSLKEQRKKLRRAPGMQKKAIRNITRSEVRSRVKAKHLKKK